MIYTKEESKIKRGLQKFGLNLASLRYEITPEKLKKKPTKLVGANELQSKMKSIYYNPVYFYPEGVKLYPNEAGHDRNFRYILKKQK